MPKTLRVPITNVCDGSDYSAQILVGSNQVIANVILDTGSSTLAVDPSIYDPASDRNARPTSLAQLVQYGDGSGWLGPVVNTSLVMGQPGDNVTLRHAPIAVTDFETTNNWSGTVDGIMGLAYYALNDAYNLEEYLRKNQVVPPATWPWPFPSGVFKDEVKQFLHLVAKHKVPTPDIQPYFNELLEHQLTLNKFAFYTLRSWVHMASTNQNAIARDPLNNGIFVLGGGQEEKDLYTGGFVHVDVLDDIYYNTNLLAVQVDGCPVHDARPLQQHFKTEDYTNSIMDTGTSALYLAYDVYNAVLASLESLNPKFHSMIRQAAIAPNGIDSSLLNLAEWPGIHFILTGADGRPVKLTCSPSTYWQVNYPGPGYAVFQILQNSTVNQANQSILGLPLFNNYYTVFDRSQGRGNGVVSFAKIAQR